nr:hypothetical protein [uncultured Brevundimonas sp.]
MLILPLAFAGFVAVSPAASAAPPQTQASCAQPAALAPGAGERRAILNALRSVVARELGGSVEFVVTQIRVIGPHAFVIVTPQRPGGRAIPQPSLDMDGVRTEAILAKRKGRWVVTRHGIGATDVWYADEIGNYPAGLIPAC